MDGNSGPYLQYTYARCHSVLEKSGEEAARLEPNLGIKDLSASEAAVLRTLYRFDEVVSQAAKDLSPNIVANFLYDLAQKFNYFYNVETILKAEKGKKEFRLWLTYATAEVLKKGLNLLGITAPEKM